jgi:hypothetical protein
MEAPADFAAATLGPMWRLGFGDTSFVFAPLDPSGWLADAAATENSHSVGSRPDSGSPLAPSWALMPLVNGPPAEPVTAVRHFFKVAVLLVDLFEARHIFWSPGPPVVGGCELSPRGLWNAGKRDAAAAPSGPFVAAKGAKPSWIRRAWPISVARNCGWTMPEDWTGQSKCGASHGLQLI